jgi:hypothetical protein
VIMLSIKIDEMNDNERNNKLKQVYSILLTMDSNELKTELKNYLENQNNELKSDRYITNSPYFKTIDQKEAEILRSYIPCFIFHIDSNKTYNESVDEFDHMPIIIYDLLDIFYLVHYNQIYKLIETNLKLNYSSYWCVII